MREAGDHTPRFRPERAAASGTRGLPVLLAMLLLVGVALLARPLWEPRLGQGVLIEVVGDVPRPGTYIVPGGKVADALEAAGADATGHTGVVPFGHRVILEGDTVRIAPPSDPLLVALPVDLNAADEDTLAAIPGLSRATAASIVADREARGPFASADTLTRVPGIGRGTVDRIRPFVVPVDDVEPAMIDVNVASAAELEGLPGIGPVTAAQIVVEREDRGPFRDVEDLQRVRGIGPATADGLRERVRFSEPP